MSYHHKQVTILGLWLCLNAIAIPTTMAQTLEDDTGYQPSAQADSLQLFYYGYFNLFTIYTDLKKAYADNQMPAQSLTFAPYPEPNLVNNAEQPLLFLAVEGHRGTIMTRLSLNLVHTFNGYRENFSKALIMRMPPTFEATKYSTKGTFKVLAGNCTGANFMSPLTLSGQSIYTHPFDRLPWDWQAKTFARYDTLYSSRAEPLKVNGLNAAQGMVVSGEHMFGPGGFKIFYGKTNFTSTPAQVHKSLPAWVLAAQVSIPVRGHAIKLNNYHHYSIPTPLARPVKQTISSLQYQKQLLDHTSIWSELAICLLDRPGTRATTTAFHAGIDREITNSYLLRFGTYHIPHDFVSLDNAVLNTNSHINISGIPDDHRYDITLFRNPVQAPDILSNNRQGITLDLIKSTGKVRVSLKQALSRELHHRSDEVTIFHHVNAFTRSRFHPWLQGSGPSGTIGGRYRYTTETLPFATGGEKLWFYAVDLRTRSRARTFGKDLLLFADLLYRRAGTHLLADTPLSSLTADLTAFIKLSPKIALSANIATKHNQVDGERSRSQSGISAGGGLDIEIARNAGLYLRYSHFEHVDKDLPADHFAGSELITELKIFF